MGQPAALINGKAYDYTQIRVLILGGELFGVKAINYKEEQEKENNFGVGNLPVSRGEGPINSSASIELSMNDVEAIRDSVADRKLLSIPAFDIQVTFLNAQKVVTHILKNCGFVNDGMEGTQGDKDLSMTYDLVVSNINYKA